MKDIIPIDIAFDFADDYLEGRKDPDGHNNILCNWHKTLWEKELPYNKGFFTLDKKRERYNYLYHNSNLGEHFLTSDAIINEYYDYLSNGRHKDMQLIISQFSKEDINSFFHKITTIGGYIVFPIGKGYTLNQARGCSGKISNSTLLLNAYDFIITMKLIIQIHLQKRYVDIIFFNYLRI